MCYSEKKTPGKLKYGKYLFFTVFEGWGNYTLYTKNYIILERTKPGK